MTEIEPRTYHDELIRYSNLIPNGLYKYKISTSNLPVLEVTGLANLLKDNQYQWFVITRVPKFHQQYWALVNVYKTENVVNALYPIEDFLRKIVTDNDEVNYFVRIDEPNVKESQ